MEWFYWSNISHTCRNIYGMVIMKQYIIYMRQNITYMERLYWSNISYSCGNIQYKEWLNWRSISYTCSNMYGMVYILNEGDTNCGPKGICCDFYDNKACMLWLYGFMIFVTKGTFFLQTYIQNRTCNLVDRSWESTQDISQGIRDQGSRGTYTVKVKVNVRVKVMLKNACKSKRESTQSIRLTRGREHHTS